MPERSKTTAVENLRKFKSTRMKAKGKLLNGKNRSLKVLMRKEINLPKKE